MFYKTLAPGCIGHGVSFLDVCDTVQEFGFQGYWFDAAKDFKGDPEAVKEKLADTGLIAAGFSLPVEYRKGEAEYQAGMEKLPAYIEFAAKLGIKRCITWIVPFHERLSYNENFELHRNRLTPAAQMLNEHGIWLGLEFLGPKKLRKNAPYSFVHDLDGMLELCDAIGTGNCGILVDAWHWHMAEQKFTDFDKFTKQEQIVCVHVMDAPANVPDDEQEDLIRRLPGTTGIINLPEFFAGLAKVGYEGPVLVEPFEGFLGKIPFVQAIGIVKKSLDTVWPE